MTDQSVMPALEQFRQAIARIGITPPDHIVSDGELHRFASNGKSGDTAGWYVFREGAIAAGAFGDFRTGLKVESWVADIGRPLTAAERVEFKGQQAELKTERQLKKEQLQEEARAKAYGIGRASLPADASHPYLVKKDVGAHGGIAVWEVPHISVRHDESKNEDYLQLASRDRRLRVGFGINMEGRTLEDIREEWESILLIPMLNDSGNVQSFQFISKRGDKKFLYGGKTEGSYFPIGDYKNDDIILIVEGYATAATIYEVTGRPVIVAYNAGNLMAVAKSIRAQRPDARIVLCADDDWKTQTIGRGGIVLKNPGVTKAKEAAAAINGEVVIPEFGINRPDKATDFNDMATLEGKAAVTAFFTKHYLAKESDMTRLIHGNDNDEAYAGFSCSDLSNKPVPESPPPARILTGRISNFGPAPYKHNTKNGPSYFITLRNGDDERTVWGIDLGKALAASGFTIGDQVALYDKGKVPIQIMSKIHDATGAVIAEQPKTVYKNEWHIGSHNDYIASRKQMARDMVHGDLGDEPDYAPEAPPQQHTAAPFRTAARPAVDAQRAREPAREPIREAAPNPRMHFSDDDFPTIQRIWKDVPRRATRHSEAGYDILIDDKSKVRVTKHRIELGKKPKQRPDAAYIAACEHARHFWDSAMEVHGDVHHRMKTYAYASVYGVKIVNYTPNDHELIEINKMVAGLHKEVEPIIRRPNRAAKSSAAHLNI